MTRPASAALAVAGAAALWLAAWLGGCGSDAGVVEKAAAGGGGSVTTTTTTTTTGTSSTSASSSSGSCPPQPVPDVVPEGWVEYPDWSCECRLYVPPTTAELPPPIEWKPCPDPPAGIDCHMLEAEWMGKLHSSYIEVMRDGNGNVVLDMMRSASEGYSMLAVADLDGPVRSAIMLPWYGQPNGDTGCRLSNDVMSAEGMRILNVKGHDAAAETISKHGGAIGGPIDELHPTVLFHDPDSGTHDWACSGSWIARYAPGFVLTVHPWDLSEEIFVTSTATDPEGMKVTQWVMHGDALFWMTSTLKHSGINVWDPVDGTRPFRRWIGDYTRGAADLGTDGEDLVWSEGEGKEPNDWHYPIRSVMTAPFTTDPDALQPKRLRSLPSWVGNVRPWEVGCGYGTFDAGSGNVFVVRLSDGHAWFVPDTADYNLHLHRGVSCEEVFVLGDIHGETTLARIRLDSLGPGVPAD